MKTILPLFTLLLLFQNAQLTAQEEVSLSIPDTTITTEVDRVCIPIVADSFPDIAAMQFSLTWDASILDFDALDLGDNPLDIAQGTTFTPTDSTFGISWLAMAQPGYTIASGTTILSVCFNVLAEAGTSVISFDSYLSPEFVQNGMFVLFPTTLTGGSVTIEEVPGLPVLPGDTNLDSLVNADDLLNIGLAFGTSGPARENATTAFTVQEAAPWGITTPQSGVDFAHVNADGNTVIDAMDQAVMEANYGSSLNGFREPISSANGLTSVPFIYLVSDTLIGGQVSTIDVFLGTEEDPVGPGHGLSFSLYLDPGQFDPTTVNVNFSGSFLGDDLLTFAEYYPNELGLLEIALSRKDQQNSAAAGGKVCTITLTPNQDVSDFEAEVFITPYRYIDAEENETTLAQIISRVFVLNTSSLSEPSWASGLVVSPNPVQDGFLRLSISTAEFEQISLFDSNGRLVQHFATTSAQLDVQSLPAATYFLRLYRAGDFVIRKVVIR